MFKKVVQKGRSERRAEAYPLGYVEGLNDARTLLAAFFNTLLTLFRGVSDERTKMLLQFLAASGRACHLASLMFFQCHDNQ